MQNTLKKSRLKDNASRIRKHLKILLLGAFLITTLSAATVAHADSFGDFWDSLWDDETSFTDFEGEFKTPDSDYYPGELTETKNLRDFILRITNFILSFLGITAVIAVIYGGILYVTSGGEQEKADKGKKTIQYALMGVLVVMVSYALVNTLILGAATGEEPGGSGNVASTPGHGTAGSFTRTAGEVADQIGEIAEAIQDEYFSYNETTEALDRLGAYIESKIDNDADYPNNTSTYKGILNEIRSNLMSIRNKSDSLSETGQAVDAIINYIDRTFIVQGASPMDYGDIMSANVLIAIGVVDCSSAADNYVKTLCDLLGNINNNLLNPSENLTNKDLYKTAKEDFEQKLNANKATLEELSDNYTGMNVEGDFDNIISDLGTMSVDAASIDNQNMRDILKNLNNLQKTVSEIQTVEAVITASVTKGNAPLTVIFDSYQSVDPTGETIQDNNVEWDLEGSCGGQTGARVNCTYSDSGAFEVKVIIKSSDALNYASGQASIKITVDQPRSKIVLKATANETETILADYSADSRVDVKSYKVTVAEAIGGIVFNATETKDSDGDDMKSYTWNFGDGSASITEAAGTQTTYKYSETGRYAFELEVEDKLGNKDRKKVDIFVGSPVARIQASPKAGDVNTVFTFDGGASRTDEGQIISYEWEIEETKKNEESFEYQFYDPGTYDVKLTVYDSTDKTDETTYTVEVVSIPPVAILNYTVKEPYEPNVVELDASKSYDTDPLDTTLEYLWEFPHVTEGVADDVVFTDGNETSESATVQFKSIGKKEITLIVTDQHGEKSDITKKVNIESILDLNFFIGGQDEASEVLAYQLTENTSTGQYEAVVTFYPESDGAIAYEMNFGDGQREIFDATETSIDHVYTAPDILNVTLTAFDANNNDNSLTRQVYVGSGDAPIAVLTVSIDEEDVKDISAEARAYRTSTVEFDAGASVNIDGTGRKLDYLWYFSPVDTSCNDTAINDANAEISRQKTLKRSFKDLGCYLAKLNVTNKDNREQIGTSKVFTLKVVGAEPTVETIVVTPQDADRETPLKVKVQAIGANDEDGKIEQYRWWYFPVSYFSQDDYWRGFQISGSDTTTLTINTYTNFDTNNDNKVDYGFALEMNDSDGNTIVKNSDDDGLPTLEVINGPNLPPDVKIRADHTSIFAGEYVNFYANASDPDGKIEKYEWDFDGNRAFGETAVTDEKTNSASLQHQFNEHAPEGIPVRVRVYDESGSFTDSDPVTIYVDTDTEDPVAAFSIIASNYEGITGETTITIGIGSSTVDSSLEIKSANFNCDMNKDTDDDVNTSADLQTMQANCIYDYFGAVKIELTLTDSEGNIDTKTLGTYLSTPPEPAAPTAAFTFTVDEIVKTANLISKSTADVGLGASLTQWLWDFDTFFDSDGDGVTNNDVDNTNPTDENLTADYSPENGSFKVKLTVVDNNENSDFVERIVTIPKPGETPSPESAFTYSIDPNDDKNVIFDVINAVSYADPSELIYLWDFDTATDADGNGIKDDDDETPDNITSSMHYKKYDDYGSYQVKLTVIDSEGQEDSVTRTVKVKEPADIPPPEADFTYSIDPDNDKKVYLNVSDSFSYDIDAPIEEYVWDLDTSVDSDKNGKKDDDEDLKKPASEGEVHTKDFDKYGNFTVKLTVKDSNGRKGTMAKNVYLPEPPETQPPDIAFTYRQIDDTKKVHLYGSAKSYVINDQSLTYSWDLDLEKDSDGNGNKTDDDDANDLTLSDQEFDEYGTYKIKFTAKDAEENRNSITRSLYIAEPVQIPAPEAMFSYSITDGLTATLNAEDSVGYAGGGALTYKWDFDTSVDADLDGISDNDYVASVKQTSNTYAKAGTFYVKLIVTDEDGQTDEISRNIHIPTVDEPPSPKAAFTYAIDTANTKKAYFNADTTLDVTADAKYLWDIDATDDADGNGIKSDDKDVEGKEIDVSYDEYDTYKVTLTVINDAGLGMSDSISRTINVPEPKKPAPPSAGFLAEVNDLTVAFTNTTKIDSVLGTDPSYTLEYFWDFDTAIDADGNGNAGDDNESSDENPGNIYDKYGAYKIKLMVEDSLGRTDEIIQSVYVEEPPLSAPPVAAFTYTVDDKKVTFINHSRADTENGAELSEYEWDFDLDEDLDGDKDAANDNESADPAPVNDYPEYGTYTAKLIVTDNFGNIGTVSHNVFITEPEKPDPPEAAFIYTISESDQTQKTILFDASNSAVDPAWSGIATIDEYAWDFDANTDESGNGVKDDDYAYGNPISYTFEQYKTYSVKLRVTDSEGVEGEIARTVKIEEPVYPPVEAKLITTPETSITDGKVHLEGEIDYVTFDFSDSEGEIIEYSMDKNIYYDSDGNGTKDDDDNLTAETAGQWANVEFMKEWGKIKVRLTVRSEDGLADARDVEIVFDEPKETALPIAAFTYETDPDNPKTVYFYSENSSAEAGIASYIWDFDTSRDFDGDGIRNNDTEASGAGTETDPIVKTYADYASYTAKLTIIDAKGEKDEVTRSVVIQSPEKPEAPQAAFIYETDLSDASGLKLKFDAGNSFADPDLSIVEYAWDFDTSNDMDGNGNPSDDVEKTGEEVDKTFKEYKTYRMVLTVTDSEGQKDSVSRSIVITEPREALEARLLTSPSANVSDGKVHVSGESATVNLDFSTSVGNIVKYWLDKNLYYDTNGNGIKNDDEDFTASAAGKWNGVQYEKEWGKIVSTLTVEDKHGYTDSVNIEIVFDEPESGGANVIATVTRDGIVVVLAATALFGILGIMFRRFGTEKNPFTKRPINK